MTSVVDIPSAGAHHGRMRPFYFRSIAMTHLELRARIGPDGILTLSVPVGISEANREVKVIVETADVPSEKTMRMRRDEWARFVDETAGSWRGDLERPQQGELEIRDQWP
jgi:hypothetical protein